MDEELLAQLLSLSALDPAVDPGGHGLGVATSRALLEDAGGSLEVTSRPGTGTTMRAVLPRA